jgi:hypothetical protein
LYRPIRRYPDRVHHHTAGVTRLVVTWLVVTRVVVTRVVVTRVDVAGPAGYGHAATVGPAVGRIADVRVVGSAVGSIRGYRIDGVGAGR